MKQAIAALLGLPLMVPAVFAATPDHQHPPLDDDLFAQKGLGHGQVPQQLFWQDDPNKSDPANLEQARRINAAMREQGVFSLIGLMMWSGTFHNSEPGANRTFSDDPAYNAYWEWNDARRHYFSRRADGTIWSRNYADDGAPKDAWIPPSRVLDPEDQTDGVVTYADWYADRIASFAAAGGFRGVSLADYADQMPHHDASVADFSPQNIQAFERWSGLSIAGASDQERAEDIRSRHFSAWVDYTADAHGRWWGTIVDRIEQATGDDAIYVLQKHVFPHSSRIHGADSLWMRRHADKDEIYYHVEGWSMPHARGVGGGQLSAYAAMIGTHLCREPDITRGIFMPVTGYTAYPGEGVGTGTDHFRAIDRSRARSFSDDEKTELQHKLMDGAWMLLGWVHLAARSGLVERAGEYVLTHRGKDVYPRALFEDVIRPIYPTRPYGAGFYYSTTVEKALEDSGEGLYDPLTAIGGRARGVDGGNFFPGYYVGTTVLDALQPSAHPSVWITERLDLLSEAERERLEAIAPLYDIADVDRVPPSLTPVRFVGDVTGYAFVDQRERVIIIATRDHHDRKDDISAEVVLNGIADGAYEARDVRSDETIGFSVRDGRGSFAFPLERWQTRAFITDLPGGGPR